MTEQKPLTLQLDFRSGLPIYIQIVQQIESQIAAKVLKPGDQLPTVRGLASELRVNFNTVARSYRMMDEARIISTQQGRGTYITEIPPPEVTEKLRQESLQALANRYISEAKRLNFHEREINQMVRDQLKSWKEPQDVEEEQVK
jgi:GntR family transcriptional regulator